MRFRVQGALVVITTLVVSLTGCAGETAQSLRPADGDDPGPRQPVMSFTVVAAGDLLVHPPLTRQAARDAKAKGRSGHDFTEVLAAIKPYTSQADLAVCHMEQPLATESGPFTGYPIFSAPPQLADAAADVGFDSCSTASNHTLDTGEEGVVRTLAALDRVGIKHTGSARSEQEARAPNIVNVRGVPVAHLSYTFSFNGIPLPEGKPWMANLINVRAIVNEAGRARAAGAQVVLLSLQWGTEYQHEADAGQLGLAHELLGQGIDLIIGHHVHVVQPFERIGDKWVAYGIGNVITRFPDGSPEATQDAVVPRFTFSRTPDGSWKVTTVEVLPTWMEYYPNARVVDLPAALADPAVTGERRDQYRRAHDRIVRWTNARGAKADGLTIMGPR